MTQVTSGVSMGRPYDRPRRRASGVVGRPRAARPQPAGVHVRGLHGCGGGRRVPPVRRAPGPGSSPGAGRRRARGRGEHERQADGRSPGAGVQPGELVLLLAGAQPGEPGLVGDGEQAHVARAAAAAATCARAPRGEAVGQDGVGDDDVRGPARDAGDAPRSSSVSATTVSSGRATTTRPVRAGSPRKAATSAACAPIRPAAPTDPYVRGACRSARACPVEGPSTTTSGGGRPSRRAVARSHALPTVSSSRAPGAAATKYENTEERVSRAAAGRPALRATHSPSARSGEIAAQLSPRRRPPLAAAGRALSRAAPAAPPGRRARRPPRRGRRPPPRARAPRRRSSCPSRPCR